jgi:hypothetical protein
LIQPRPVGAGPSIRRGVQWLDSRKGENRTISSGGDDRRQEHARGPVDIGGESPSMLAVLIRGRRSKSRKPNETGVSYRFSLRAVKIDFSVCAGIESVDVGKIFWTTGGAFVCGEGASADKKTPV